MGGGAAVAVQEDGKVLVVGSVDGAMRVDRYNADGTPDGGFGNAGRATADVTPDQDEAHSVALAPDGGIVIAGSNGSLTAGDDAGVTLARFTSAGMLDPTFGIDGTIYHFIASGRWITVEGVDLVVQLDGKLVVSGGIIHPVPDPGFGPLVVPLVDPVGVVIDAQRSIVVAARGGRGSYFDFVLLGFNPDGSVNRRFGRGGRTDTNFGSTQDELGDIDKADDYPRAIALVPDGRIVVAGGTFAGADGAAKPLNVTADDVAVAPDGKLVVTGPALARYHGRTVPGSHVLPLARCASAAPPRGTRSRFRTFPRRHRRRRDGSTSRSTGSHNSSRRLRSSASSSPAAAATTC